MKDKIFNLIKEKYPTYIAKGKQVFGVVKKFVLAHALLSSIAAIALAGIAYRVAGSNHFIDSNLSKLFDCSQVTDNSFDDYMKRCMEKFYNDGFQNTRTDKEMNYSCQIRASMQMCRVKTSDELGICPGQRIVCTSFKCWFSGDYTFIKNYSSGVCNDDKIKSKMNLLSPWRSLY